MPKQSTLTNEGGVNALVFNVFANQLVEESRVSSGLRALNIVLERYYGQVT